MPLSNAERKKKFIEKLKENGQFEEYKKKKAEDAKKRRDRVKVGLNALPKRERERTKRLNREYNRKKTAEYRCRKKKQEGILVDATNHLPSVKHTTRSDPITDGYKTESALNKATAKIKRSLPSNSTKTKQAVSKLLKSFDAKDIQEMIAPHTETKPKRTKAISQSDIDAVQAFYERDDISRISANVKDYRKFENVATGAKEFKQLRFLMYKLTDVHAMFEKYVENDAHAISRPVRFSKFCELRPCHVKLVGDTPLDQCRCYYHENFIACCTALNRSMPEFPQYGEKLEQIILCKNPTKDCWMRKCTKCPNVQKTLAKIMKRSGRNKDDVVSCAHWNKSDETKRFQKSIQKGPLNALLDHFCKLLPDFLKHSYIKRKQAASFEGDNDEVKKSQGEVATVQADFAEGYKCEAQDEIQSAHWNQSTTSLFTSCLKVSDDLFPSVIAADNTKHTKNEIGCYMYKIISRLPPTVKCLKIWSDGPNNQFKNKYTAALIKFFQNFFKIKIFWNFFATSHGKGCVDGIGAAVKSRVRRLVKSRQAIVNCSKDFVDAFNSEDSVIEVVEMSDDAAKNIFTDLNLENVFHSAPAIPNVFSYHQLQLIDDKIVGFSTSEEGYAFYLKHQNS